MTRTGGVLPAIGSPIAIELSIVSNFVINHSWTFNERDNGLPLYKTFFRFHLVSGLSGLVNYLVFLLLFYGFQFYDMLASFAGIAVAVLINYLLNSLWTWKHNPVSPLPSTELIKEPSHD